MTKSRKPVTEIIKEIALPIAKSLNLELWDVKFLKEGASWYLRVFIDKPDESITLEDCEKMSHALDKPLDELDPIEQSYCLEVCSPGIERELASDEHLKKYIGFHIRISLFKAHENNQKNLFGKLVSFNKDELILKDSDEIKIPRNNISKINLSVETEKENIK